MTIGPTYITIDERMSRGLCSRLQPGEAGLWYHHIPGTDVLETVYDERAGWRLTGPKYMQRLTRGPSHMGGYFAPGAPLPEPTGRCQESAERTLMDDPRNWKFVGWSKATSFPDMPHLNSPAGEWGEFKWIGPKLSGMFAPAGLMSVPRERMHEMIGARGLGQTYEQIQADYARVNATVWLVAGGSALVVGLGTKKLSGSTGMAVVAGVAAAIGAGAVMIRTGFWGGA